MYYIRCPVNCSPHFVIFVSTKPFDHLARSNALIDEDGVRVCLTSSNYAAKFEILFSKISNISKLGTEQKFCYTIELDEETFLDVKLNLK